MVWWLVSVFEWRPPQQRRERDGERETERDRDRATRRERGGDIDIIELHHHRSKRTDIPLRLLTGLLGNSWCCDEIKVVCIVVILY